MAQWDRTVIANLGIGAALLLMLFLNMVTFVPGAQFGVFCMAGGFAMVGLLSPNRRMKLFAGALVAGFALWAWYSYQEGLQYREYIRQLKEEWEKKSIE